MNISKESNYCRHVDGHNGVQCYVSKPWGNVLSYCDIAYCDNCFKSLDNTTRNECKTTRTGLEYTGRTSKSADGSVCLPWLCASNMDGESNYCRNMDGSKLGPWCYVQVG